jgi:hypothetical protein
MGRVLGLLPCVAAATDAGASLGGDGEAYLISSTVAPHPKVKGLRSKQATLVGLLMLLTSTCTNEASEPVPTSPTGKSEGSTSATVIPTDLPEPPLGEARIEGRYAVKVFVTNNSFGSNSARLQTFLFDPKCASGACNVTIAGRMIFTKGREDRQIAGASSRFSKARSAWL